jgi:hypothetical protein
MNLNNTILKITYLFFIVTIYSCKDDSTNPSNTNNNSPSGSVQYFFDIEIGGVQHKIEGNTKDIVNSSTLISNNQCYQINNGGNWTFQFSITDRSAPQYTMGENISLILATDNTKLGANTGSLNFNISNSYFKSFFESKNIEAGLMRFVEGNAKDRPDPSEINSISDIQLTDLGTPSYIPSGIGGSPCPFDPNNPGYYCWGETVKGSYSGTLYFMSKDDAYNYNIPVNVSLKFAALRLPY